MMNWIWSENESQIVTWWSIPSVPVETISKGNKRVTDEWMRKEENYGAPCAILVGVDIWWKEQRAAGGNALWRSKRGAAGSMCWMDGWMDASKRRIDRGQAVWYVSSRAFWAFSSRHHRINNTRVFRQWREPVIGWPQRYLFRSLPLLNHSIDRREIKE